MELKVMTTSGAAAPRDYMIVVLNGPPRSGKDSIANYLQQEGHPYTEIAQRNVMVMHNKASHPMKHFLMECFGVSQYDLEDKKDQPNVLPNQVTVRQAQINMFRDFLEPTFGPEVLGYLLGKRITADLSRHFSYFPDTFPLFVISDCGRTAEFLELCKQHNGHVCLLYLVRPGYNYDGDIRETIREVPPNVRHRVIFNNGSISQLYVLATMTIVGWIDSHVNGKQYGDTDAGVPSEG